MAKTSKQIQGDIYRLLRQSDLFSFVSGEVYRSGHRPRDSKKEDIVVIFTTGQPSEIQTGVVTIQIFVPDIDPYEDGVLVEDSQRIEELEVRASEWFDSLTTEVSNYRFELQQIITTDSADEINQHFIVLRLRYWYY